MLESNLLDIARKPTPSMATATDLNATSEKPSKLLNWSSMLQSVNNKSDLENEILDLKVNIRLTNFAQRSERLVLVKLTNHHNCTDFD